MNSIIKDLKNNNLFTKKKFGQNFLVDELLLDKIVNSSNDIKNQNVLEIGPGMGTLTYSILKKEPKKLVSIEIDEDFYKYLQEKFVNYKNFELVNMDALKIKEEEYFNEKIHIIANLPYNIGTTLLIKWLEKIDLFSSFTLLLQKEVVDRIVAKISTKDYGRLSVLVQSICTAKKCFDVSPNLFIPPPKVISSVVNIIPKENIENINLKNLSFITFNLFNQRRKKIKKALENLVITKKINEKVLIEIDLNKRAEEIKVEEYIKLSNYIF